MAPPAVRIGDTLIASGEARVVSVRLPRRIPAAHQADALPVFVAVGKRPGPRVVILAAPRGFETHATRVALELGQRLTPNLLAGCVVIVPVLRPGGRFASGGKPVKRALEWRMPGDPAGTRAARDAATVATEVIADASLVLVLTETEPGRAGTMVLRCDLDDARVRRLADDAGVPVLVQARLPTGWPADLPRLELSIPSTASALEEAIAVVLRMTSSLEAGTASAVPRPRRARVFRRLSPVLAPVGGLLEAAVRPGEVVGKGAPIAHLISPLTAKPRTLVAPYDSLVLEVPTRGGTRQGAKLFELGRLSGGLARHRDLPPPVAVAVRDAPRTPAVSVETPLRLGWVERVSLPSLGVPPLLAKIDTGARTSALHVTRMKTVETGGLPRRSVLEITIPGGVDGARTASVVRVQVREWVQVKDTSGRTERRPVIETTLQLGPLERRIRLTLTDRGDMLYPMLVGRTALGNGVVVDPARRRLLREPRSLSEGNGASPRHHGNGHRRASTRPAAR
jgi:predicted deacylase